MHFAKLNANRRVCKGSTTNSLVVFLAGLLAFRLLGLLLRRLLASLLLLGGRGEGLRSLAALGALLLGQVGLLDVRLLVNL